VVWPGTVADRLAHALEKVMAADLPKSHRQHGTRIFDRANCVYNGIAENRTWWDNRHHHKPSLQLQFDYAYPRKERSQ
jgi:hypothetical protein